MNAAIHIHEITVGPEAIDANGHANNIEFVRWMQEAAVAHADAAGCTAATREAGATWVVRSHQIEYHRPAFAGDGVQVRTWVADFRRAFSRRRYEFVRASDQTVLARGETDWAFIDLAAGRLRTVPPAIVGMFILLPDQPKT
jgi:acyl-CoA thioester hydrolase